MAGLPAAMGTSSDKILKELIDLCALEGYAPGTEGHDRRLRQLRVTRCREMKGVSICSQCQFFDYCDLIKQVMREKRGLKSDLPFEDEED